MINEKTTGTAWSWLLLFTSTATLLCCALPVMLVTLGLGAVVASMAATLPWLITLSLHKAWVFAGAGGLLLISAWLLYRPGRHCPPDPKLAALCKQAEQWNKRLYWLSVGIWCTGFFFAYIARYVF